jgi:hypothetical protein
MNLEIGYAAVIGDLRRSKAHARRGDVQVLLAGALARTNERIPAVQRLEPTIGDEFQGLYDNLADALQATFWIRLDLMRGADLRADVRFGVGWGGLVVLDPARVPFAQDGPAWWAARKALDWAAAEVRRTARPRGLRTWFVSFERMYEEASASDKARWSELRSIYYTQGGELPGKLRSDIDDLVNAYLLCRDQLVQELGAKEVGPVMDVLQGRTQADIAEEEGVTPSAISQRLRRSGAYALQTSERLLRKALS